MRGYRDTFIKVIISSEKNEFNNPIIKITRIPNITFCPFFIYNIILFQKLQIRGY